MEPSRLGLIVLAVGLAVAGPITGSCTGLEPNADTPPQGLLELSWYPPEQNAYLRLPVHTGRLEALDKVAFDHGQLRVELAGGTRLSSTDRGRTWRLARSPAAASDPKAPDFSQQTAKDTRSPELGDVEKELAELTPPVHATVVSVATSPDGKVRLAGTQNSLGWTIWVRNGDRWHRSLLGNDDILDGALDSTGRPWLLTSAGSVLRGSEDGSEWQVASVTGAPFTRLGFVHGMMRLEGDPSARAARFAPKDGAVELLPADPPDQLGADERLPPTHDDEHDCTVGEAKARCRLLDTTPSRQWAWTYLGAEGLAWLPNGANPDSAKWTAEPVAQGRAANRVLELKDGSFLVGGDDRLLARKAPGSAAWKPVSQSAGVHHWVYFALWVSLCLGYAAAQPRKPKEPTAGIVELLSTDRPIQSPSEDVLGLFGIASGLSRFLRNSETKPSLTVAVTGKWGSGKSSLLKLLERDVTTHGFHPVHFNAWHTEQEENVVAALYAAIADRGYPQLPSLQAVRFRLVLALRRAWRHPLGLVASMLLLTGGLFFFGTNDGAWTDVKEHLAAVGTKPEPAEQSAADTKAKHLEGGALNVEHLPKLGALLSMLLGLLGVGKTATERLKTFGIEPEKLVERLGGGEAKAQVGFHAAFANDFADVTRALQPWRLFILVDDLERCSPKNALRVLEALNFLSTSGECFVVMAVAMDVLEKAVAKALADAGLTEDPKHYLEKLINVQLEVPQLTDGAAAQLLKQSTSSSGALPAGDEARRKKLVSESLMHEAAAWAWRVKSTAFVLGLLLFAGGTGHLVGQWSRSQASPTPVLPLESQPVLGAVANPGLQLAHRFRAANLQPPGLSPPPAEPLQQLYALATLFGLLVATGLVMFWRPTGVLLRDSDAFTDALCKWAPSIRARHGTPRAMKRFLNKLRFAAMQNEPVLGERMPLLASLRYAFMAGQPSGWAAVWRRLRYGTLPGETSGPAPDPNDALQGWLVALSALIGETQGAGWDEQKLRDVLSGKVDSALSISDASRARVEQMGIASEELVNRVVAMATTLQGETNGRF